MMKFDNAAVEQAFQSLPPAFIEPALRLRELILTVGSELEATGGVEETLKWGQPSYLPRKKGIGSTLRIARHDDEHLGLYFNCNTTLVETFRDLFATDLQYSKNRAVLLNVSQALPEDLIRPCICMGLYYHRDRKAGVKPSATHCQ